jgi:hypothetical protein
MKARKELELSRHVPRPYWNRAHHDWKFRVGLVLMLTAMFIYVTTDDLASVPRIHSRQTQSDTSSNGGVR